MFIDLTPEQEWHDFLSGTHPHLHHAMPFRLVPSSPRCRLCAAPFRAPGSAIFKRLGFTPWEKNPNLCKRCFTGLQLHAALCPTMSESDVHGAEVDVSMLFADIRLPGTRDGVQLAACTLWPTIRIVLTSGDPDALADDLSGGVTFMPKRWRGLVVLVEAEGAVQQPQASVT